MNATKTKRWPIVENPSPEDKRPLAPLAQPKTAEHINAQHVGQATGLKTLTDGEQNKSTPRFALTSDGISTGNIDAWLQMVRAIRDNRMYELEGCTCFRAWTMKHFGDKLGIWLDEIL